MKRARTAILLTLTATLFSLVAVFPAYGWQNGRNARGYGTVTTQQWILQKANDLAVSSGADWLDVGAALATVGAPDTRLHDLRHHTYDRWGPRRVGDAPARIAAVYDDLLEALRADDTQTASSMFGLLAHYYSDICSPLHTDNSRLERRRALHRRYEQRVMRILNRSGARVSGAVDGARVEDITVDLAGFSVATATEAHHDYRRLVRAFARHGFSKATAASTSRTLERAVSGQASVAWL